MLLSKSGHGFKALMAVARDTIVGMYAHMTVKNDNRYVHLFFMLIRGHKRSMVFTKGHQKSHINNNTQGPNVLHAYSNFYQKLYRVCKFDHQDH